MTKYISGQHALNLSCSLPTSGDWHIGAIQWEHPWMRDSADSIFGDYGIETNRHVPQHEKQDIRCANHIRALLDLLETGNFAMAQGMRNDFICNDTLNDEIFAKVVMLKDSSNWERISAFMGKEYGMLWLNYLKRNG